MKQQLKLGQYWSLDSGYISPEIAQRCSYVKPDLKLREIPAASPIRLTCAIRTIVIFLLKKSNKARLPFMYFRLGPRGPPGRAQVQWLQYRL